MYCQNKKYWQTLIVWGSSSRSCVLNLCECVRAFTKCSNSFFPWRSLWTLLFFTLLFSLSANFMYTSSMECTSNYNQGCFVFDEVLQSNGKIQWILFNDFLIHFLVVVVDWIRFLYDIVPNRQYS